MVCFFNDGQSSQKALTFFITFVNSRALERRQPAVYSKYKSELWLVLNCGGGCGNDLSSTFVKIISRKPFEFITENVHVCKLVNI